MKPLSEHILSQSFAPTGFSLIEASAGTGKTFSIQTLYLRLVVEHGIPVEKILVVTFTEAATAELRERLRKILEESYKNLTAPEEDPPEPANTDTAATNTEPNRIKEILALVPHSIPERINAEEMKKRRLRRALLDFDQAAVFTIHGFCQRTLNEFAFECGQDFDTEVISGDALLAEICTDHWRAIMYKKPTNAAEDLIQAKFPDPTKLTSLAKTYIGRHGIKLQPEAKQAGSEIAQIESIIDRAVDTLQANQSAIIGALRKPESDFFFASSTEIDNIERLITSFCGNPPPDKWQSLQMLNEIQAKLVVQIGNPTTIPENINVCLVQAKTCVEFVKTHDFAPKGKNDPWSPPVSLLTEWQQMLASVMSALRNQQDNLKCFVKDVVQQYPERFFDNEFKNNTAILEKRLNDILADGGSPKECRTALEKISKIKPLPKLTWDGGTEVKNCMKAADDANTALTAYANSFLATDIKRIAAKYAQRKHEARGMTFDDMIIRLQQVVEGKPEIASTIRSAYDAALIDEFQDTDPAQYSIFSNLFGGTSLPVFLVGDPKQAIYSFRGGDIYTYCEAKTSEKTSIAADNRFELDMNFRSQQSLITAVNTIFKDREASLFAHESISYDGKLKCKGLKEQFKDEGTIDNKPFRIWTVERSDGKNQGKTPSNYSSTDAQRIYEWVAEEAVRLLNDPNTGFVNERGNLRRIKASDIAILVRRHKEAQHLYKQLAKRGVPVVRQAAGNIFATSEATSLFYVIRAMHDPGNIRYVRTALASHLLPVTDDDLRRMAEQTSAAMTGKDAKNRQTKTLDEWIGIFQEASHRWAKNGFYAGFADLLEKSGMKAHIASCPQGERQLSYILQLGDILHRICAERAFGPAALLAWYTSQLSADSRETDDAFETRLESDAEAVQIMTFFKSKGLEFPVVFVPTLWSSQVGMRQRTSLIYHAKPMDENSHADIYMHLDTADKEAKAQADAEKAQEDIRNFYVAATRASFRTYVVTGTICGKDSTLDKCLPPDLLEAWGTDTDSAISVEPISSPAKRIPYQPSGDGTDADLLAVQGEATVDKSRSHASFSSIAPKGDGGSSARDYDDNDVSDNNEQTGDKTDLNIFSFPAGKRTGNCWHKIFEDIDFTGDAEAIAHVIDEQLKLARLDKGTESEAQAKRSITQTMVKTVLEAPLKADAPSLRLKTIPRKDRISEMSFDFAIQGSGNGNGDDEKRNAVWNVLHEAWGNAIEDSPYALFLARLKNWSRTIPNGFMTGFIDLIFRKDGKFYILDWKSNRLDGQAKNFEQAGLVQEMAKNAYFLQYLIYTVALDRYLRQSLRDYDYDTHFGGGFYLFLRGMEPHSQRGVFFDKPEKNLIAALSKALSTQGGK